MEFFGQMRANAQASFVFGKVPILRHKQFDEAEEKVMWTTSIRLGNPSV
jgi:hypothetical protein